jgi:hypothetical protein
MISTRNSTAPTDSILAFERWAKEQGVDIEVLGLLSSPHTLTLNWIERHQQAPRGVGQKVIEALCVMADTHQQAVDLVCLAGSLEDYYTQRGFVTDSLSRDEDTGDVVMIRQPGPAPVPMATPEPRRRRPG